MNKFEQMNAALLKAEEDAILSFEKPDLPVTFMISQPRAASALFIQLLFTRYKIGYVSNLISRFWAAPSFGVALHKNLEVETQGTSFATGLTIDGPLEPHEWGFFWRQWLKLEGDQHYSDHLDDVDWQGLQKTIAAMEAEFKAPMIFDSPFFHCNVTAIEKAFPKALYLKTHREPFFVCNSIINARIARHGTIEGFYGNCPRAIDQILALDDPIEQIVMQVFETEKEINTVLAKIPDKNKLIITYAEIINEPASVVDIYQKKLSELGTDLISRNIDLPNQLNSRDIPAVINQTHKKRLCQVFEKYFGYLPSDRIIG